LITSPDDISLLCNSSEQVFNTTNYYDSHNFTTAFNENSIVYTSDPNYLQTTEGLLCYSDLSNISCPDYTRTFTFPSPATDSDAIMAFYVGGVPECGDGDTLTVYVTATDGTTTQIVKCEDMQEAAGFGIVSSEPIENFTITSTFSDYILYVLVLFTSCDRDSLLSDKPSPAPSSMPSLTPPPKRSSLAAGPPSNLGGPIPKNAMGRVGRMGMRMMGVGGKQGVIKRMGGGMMRVNGRR
jgi:hypothetical protein